MSAFHLQPATDLVAVGHVDAASVRVWLRAHEPARHVLELWPAGRRRLARSVRFDVTADRGRDGTVCVRYPYDFPGATPLDPGSAYEYALFREHGARLVGEGGFATGPTDSEQAPERFSLAFMSCHQPFGEDGRPHPAGRQMLALLESEFRAHNVVRVLLLGDQMYADYPHGFSLFDPAWFRQVAPRGRKALLDCTRSEIRALYQARYRVFWALPEYRRLLAGWPSYPIPDDHELCDNFGSHPEHASARWRALHDGALDACNDYQSLRVHGRVERPRSLHFAFRYGPCAVFVLDLRSQRVATEKRVTVFQPTQLAALTEFLEKTAKLPVVCVGLSVPLVHVPNWVADTGVELAGQGSDAADRWEFAAARESRAALVCALAAHRRAHPDQLLFLLGGDIHTGVISSVELGASPAAMQLVSSAVTNVESVMHRGIASVLSRMQHRAVTGEGDGRCRATLLAGEPGSRANPYAGLNVGFLELRRVARREWGARVELFGCDPTSGRGRVVYARDIGTAAGD